MSTRAAFVTRCTGCGVVHDKGFVPFCTSCGAMTDIDYDLDAVTLRPSENPYERFFDLLPVLDVELLDPDARFTPVPRSERLGAALSMDHLYLKNETVLPTCTTKDRMATVALPYLHERGTRQFATSSTGNSSSAYAHHITRVPDLTMFVFTAERFRDRLTIVPSDQVVDVVLRDATFVDAFEASKTFADSFRLTAERGFFNPGRREGLKVAWLEAAEQVPHHIDWYVQAVSSAMGVYGVYKGAVELHRLGLSGSPPRLLCVQEDTCAPMVSAWRDGAEQIRPGDIVADPRGIAAAIQRGDPSRAYPHVRRIVRESGGSFVAVPESAIREARAQLEELEGISVCFAAAAALAGLFEARRTGIVEPHETVLVNLSGGDRTGSPAGPGTYVVERAGTGWDFSSIDPIAREIVATE